MPWPELQECERWVDWSWYQNHGLLALPPRKPFDVDAFLDAHPYIEGAIIRAVWPNGSPDQHYAHYHDGFLRNGRRVAAYLWPNPRKSVAGQVEDWKRALGDRVPKLIGFDYEESSTFQGISNQQLTTLMRTIADGFDGWFPDQQTMQKYSRGSWLDERIIPGPWMGELFWWFAHWIFPQPDVRRQARSFAEIDSLLPIDNGFTPFRGRTTGIPPEMVVAWQFSSRLEIVPNGTSDGDYLLKSFTRQVYDGPAPPPDPDPDPDPGQRLSIEVRVPQGKVDVTVTEVDA